MNGKGGGTGARVFFGRREARCQNQNFVLALGCPRFLCSTSPAAGQRLGAGKRRSASKSRFRVSNFSVSGLQGGRYKTHFSNLQPTWPEQKTRRAPAPRKTNQAKEHEETKKETRPCAPESLGQVASLRRFWSTFPGATQSTSHVECDRAHRFPADSRSCAPNTAEIAHVNPWRPNASSGHTKILCESPATIRTPTGQCKKWTRSTSSKNAHN